MSEEWRAVVGYEGVYEVSNEGRVRSVDRVDARGVFRVGKVLKPILTKDGYATQHLSRAGVQKIRRIHQLVLEAFVGSCPEGMEGCHNDGDPSNNHLANLRWDTKSANTLDQVAHGTHNLGSRTHCPLGHPLEGANLVPGQYGRKCLACSRARSFASGRGIPFTAALADEYYEKTLQNPGGWAESDKTHCPLGHPLEEPNLEVAQFLRRGKRKCLSCGRARAYARAARIAFSQSLADDYYNRLLIATAA